MIGGPRAGACVVAAAGMALAVALGPTKARADGAHGEGGASNAARTSWPLDGTSCSLQLALPRGVQPLTDDALPTVSDAGVPGIRTLVRRGVARVGSEARVVGVCVRAPSAGFGRAIAMTVFDKLNETTRAELARHGFVDRYDAQAMRDSGARLDQRYSADVTPAGERGRVRGAEIAQRVHAEGRHIVGFLGEQLDVVACSVGCTEPAGETGFCTPVLASLALSGPLVEPPPSSWLGRAQAALVRRPLKALGAVLGMGLMVAGVFVARGALARAA
jgi:hypothetical protein